MMSSRSKSQSFPSICKDTAVRLVGSRLLMIFLVLSLVLAAGSRLAGQDIVGRISGTVTDSSGASVAEAKVTITNEATLIVREITADKDGYFAADQLPAGIYSVSGEQPGFKITTKKGNMLT